MTSRLKVLDIYLFSFNRGQFLENCLNSIKLCAPDCRVTVIDDQSTDPITRDILDRYKDRHEVVTIGDPSISEYKTGGLYNNMRYALERSRKAGTEYALFIQDDMQLVRPILEEDVISADRFFAENKNSAELHTCFMKRYYAPRDERQTVLDSSCEAYLRPSDPQRFSGFSAVGLFNIERFYKLFGSLRQGEYMNNEFAQRNGIQMGISTRPFMMWLPYPISNRGKKRNVALQIVEAIGGCGFYPYKIMNDQDITNLLKRDISIKPYAEDWLEAQGLKYVHKWNYAGGLSNLYVREGLRGNIGELLYLIKYKKRLYKPHN